MRIKRIVNARRLSPTELQFTAVIRDTPERIAAMLMGDAEYFTNEAESAPLVAPPMKGIDDDPADDFDRENRKRIFGNGGRRKKASAVDYPELADLDDDLDGPDDDDLAELSDEDEDDEVEFANQRGGQAPLRMPKW